MYRLGILAGMGPRSTTPFLETALDECERQYGAEFDMDYPHMVVYSLPTPFYLDRPMVKHDMLEALELGLNTLTRAECAVPCNSVHVYYREMCALTSVPILHIVDATIAQLTPQPGRVGLLATWATVESAVYQ